MKVGIEPPEQNSGRVEAFTHTHTHRNTAGLVCRALAGLALELAQTITITETTEITDTKQDLDQGARPRLQAGVASPPTRRWSHASREERRVFAPLFVSSTKEDEQGLTEPPLAGNISDERRGEASSSTYGRHRPLPATHRRLHDGARHCSASPRQRARGCANSRLAGTVKTAGERRRRRGEPAEGRGVVTPPQAVRRHLLPRGQTKGGGLGGRRPRGGVAAEDSGTHLRGCVAVETDCC